MIETLKENDSYELAKACGRSQEEWSHFLKVLGRVPSPVEIQMVGVQWREHCSYKSSKAYLKKLITEGEHVLLGPGRFIR